MAAKILDGKALASSVRSSVKDRVLARRRLGHRPPGLATVLVGEDPASHVYVRNKRKAAEECGIVSVHHALPAETPKEGLLEIVARLNADPEVDGILVQLPVPEHIDESAVIRAIDPDKDVDGFHPENVARLVLGLPGFVPCTPRGCLRILDEAGATLRGARAVVVGRSNIVGRPVAQLLLQRDATVTLAHSRTKDLAAVCREADVLVVAVGRAKMIGPEHVKPGAFVIDVGMNKDEAGKLCGDVDTSAVLDIAAAVTPVPGGVGPMTIAMLLDNTLTSHARRLGLPEDT